MLDLSCDITTAVTVGGRVVFEHDEIEKRSSWNPCLSFRRPSEAGIETFLILGDPSGEKFTHRLEGKPLEAL